MRDAVARAWTERRGILPQHLPDRITPDRGRQHRAEASLNKIFWSEMDVQMHETALALLGARAELLSHAPEAGDVGDWLDGYLFSLAGPIYAGTNEIQRNVIAERLLGLPR